MPPPILQVGCPLALVPQPGTHTPSRLLEPRQGISSGQLPGRRCLPRPTRAASHRCRHSAGSWAGPAAAAACQRPSCSCRAAGGGGAGGQVASAAGVVECGGVRRVWWSVVEWVGQTGAVSLVPQQASHPGATPGVQLELLQLEAATTHSLHPSPPLPAPPKPTPSD